MVEQIENGHQPTKNLSVKFINNSRRIIRAVESFEVGLIGVWGFMQRCTHASANYLERQRNWTNAIEPPQLEEIQPEPFDEIHHHLGKDNI